MTSFAIGRSFADIFGNRREGGVYFAASLDIADVLKRIPELKNSVKNRICRNALRKAGQELKNAVKDKARALKKSGALAVSIGIKVATRNNVTTAIVGPKTNYSKIYKGKRFVPFRYAGPLEKGHGKTAARPFLKPSFNRQALQDKLRQSIEDQVSKQLAK